MNILGMGTFELLVILLVAFIFLGPRKMIDAARMLGKVSREMRKMSSGLPELVLHEEEERTANRPSPRNDIKEPDTTAKSGLDANVHDPDEDGQVGFKPSAASDTLDQNEPHGHHQRRDRIDS